MPTESQKDLYLRLWHNQVAMAMRLVPQIPSVAVRCASPDLSLRYVQYVLYIYTVYLFIYKISANLNININISFFSSNLLNPQLLPMGDPTSIKSIMLPLL